MRRTPHELWTDGHVPDRLILPRSSDPKAYVHTPEDKRKEARSEIDRDDRLWDTSLVLRVTGSGTRPPDPLVLSRDVTFDENILPLQGAYSHRCCS